MGVTSKVGGESAPGRFGQGLRRIEWIAAGLLTLLAVWLHLLFLRHAGALWRDEVSSIDLANLPGFTPLWGMLTHDSFPLLWSFVLRFWETIGLGGTDAHLRCLGFVIGAFLLIAIWIAGLLINRRPPLLALSLFFLNAIVVRSADSLRAYGLGTALIILTVAVLWHFYKKPTTGNGLLAAGFGVLSVQCLYQNAFLLLAVGLSAALVAALQKQWRQMAWILGVGAIAAISLLPYLPQITRSQDWWIVERNGLQREQLWQKVSQAIGTPRPWFNFVWAGLVVLTLAVGGRHWLRMRKKNANSSEIIRFAALVLMLGLGGFLFFLKVARLQTQPWYYLPLMGFVVLCVDLVLSNTRWLRPLLIGVALATAALSYPVAAVSLENRQTNLDMLADQLSREATPNDLIVLNTWYYGVTFQRYYHGNTPWLTVPPLADLSLHRYDLMKLEMQKRDAVQPVLARVSATLRAGNRVWLVGRIPLEGQPPPAIQPAPNNPWGWQLFPHTQVWSAQLGYFLALHATGAQPVPITSGISSFENVELASVSGWRD